MIVALAEDVAGLSCFNIGTGVGVILECSLIASDNG